MQDSTCFLNVLLFVSVKSFWRNQFELWSNMSYQYHHGGSSPYGHSAPTYNYNPLHQAQAGPYGQQIVPAYPPPAPYAQQPPYGYGSGQQLTPYQGGAQSQHLQAEEQRHRQNEHRAAIGAIGAVAFAAVSLQYKLSIFIFSYES